MTALNLLRSKQGFTLIELMIVIAVLGIFLATFMPARVRSQRVAESEIALQRAVRALQNEVEILRAAPGDTLKPGRVIPFDPRVKELDYLVAGRGAVRIEQDAKESGLMVMRVEVHWRDPLRGMRSIHTVLFRTP
jgi:prepilin-type N-terminal cleavage/methylation domain-containing protein